MKIVYDNIIFSLQKSGGISIYWSELIKRLKYKEGIVFFESENKNIFRRHINLKIKSESKINFTILRYLPFLKILPKKSIFHSSYYRVSFQKNIINITTVHDFTYEYFRGGLAKYIHVWQKGFAIKKSNGIICVSENTKKDLMKFYPMIEESKVKVIYNGVGDEFKELKNPQEFLVGEFEALKNKKYLLYIGDRSGYKNFNIAIKVIQILTDYSLVVVGGKEFNLDEKETMEEIENRVYHFKGIGSDKLNAIYNNAFCLLYPSSYEGFGIPIPEAMKSGCPVISVNISSIPEVAGNAGLLVGDIDADNFIKQIKKLEVSSFRNKLIIKGLKQSERFSWDKCFDETYGFYEEVYERKFN
jgi:glycosyltransferase involved in cell wall biosynthesis